MRKLRGKAGGMGDRVSFPHATDVKPVILLEVSLKLVVMLAFEGGEHYEFFDPTALSAAPIRSFSLNMPPARSTYSSSCPSKSVSMAE